MTADRKAFRARLAGGEAVMAPLCLDAFTSRLLNRLGYEAGYLSGGALGFSLAVSEALLTLTEVANATRAIARRSDLPLIVDIGGGFGDPVHVTRTIWEVEAAGATAVELEDQLTPFHVSRHRGVSHLIDADEMCAKVAAAVAARSDSDLLVIARTGAAHQEGLDAAIERANAYLAAGADLVLAFSRSLADIDLLGGRIDGPAATIARHDAHAQSEWTGLGYRLVLDQYTGHALIHGAVRDALAGQLAGTGSGLPPDETASLYAELAVVAGLEPLYDIERATTEPGT